MRDLLLAPHNDDETLFASYLILRYRPHVIVCFRSTVQGQRGGPSAMTREIETGAAMGILGTTWEQLPEPDVNPDPTILAGFLSSYAADPDYQGWVWVPAVEEGGHEQHTLVAEVAEAVFGKDRLRHYLTYRRGHRRTRSEHTARFAPSWPALKLRAMACYSSQIGLPSAFPWFNWEPLVEYVAQPEPPLDLFPAAVPRDGRSRVRRPARL